MVVERARRDRSRSSTASSAACASTRTPIVRISDSIVDATDPTRVAYAALDGAGAGGELSVVAGTVIGKVHARILRLVSNSILAARLADGRRVAVPGPRRAAPGGLRPLQLRAARARARRAATPASRRAPADAARVQPQFTVEPLRPSRRTASSRCAARPSCVTGSDDESEMGAFHDLFAPQRETNVTVRLDEYLRFGLEAGIFYAS